MSTTTIFAATSLSFELLRTLNSAAVQGTQIAGDGPVLTVRCAVELYGDFAMVRSYAIEDFHSSRTLPVGNGLLDVSTYYFGLGYTGSARLSADRDPFEVGAGYRYGSYWSINSLPDDPEQPNLDLDVRDSRAIVEAWLSYRVSERVTLRAAVERTVRDGSVEEFSPPAAAEVRTFATLSYRLR